jgi:PKD repeat protein
MKNKNFIYSIFFFSAIMVIGFACKKKLPSACFIADKTEIEVGQTVNFTSCSKETVKMEWDFGDGITATGESASHTYQKAGVYIVQVRAYSKKDKATDRYSAAITVKDPPPPPPAKKRILTTITINSFPQTKPDNSNWDGFPSTGNAVNPDLYVKMELINGNWNYASSELSNATQSNLPYTWDLSPSNIKLTNQNWKISLIDNDALTGLGNGDTLLTQIINPYTISTTGGKFTLSNTSASLTISFIEE